MRDYKFHVRRNLLSSKDRRRRGLGLRLGLLALALGGLYAVLHFTLLAPASHSSAAPASPTAPHEVIELPLPPEPRPRSGNDTVPGNASVSPTPVLATPSSDREPAPFPGPFVFVYEVQPGDTLSDIFQTLGIDGRELPRWLARLAPEHAQRLEHLRTGERLTIALDETGQLDTLQLSLDAVRTLHARREANRLIAQVDALPTEQRQRCLSAVINPSLRAATRAAGIPDAIANRALAVFRPQVDLARTLRTGDRLTVLFEQTWVQDRVVATGDLLAVAIVNGKRRYSAVRYTDRDGKTAYYTPDAEPLARRQLALLRAPLVYTRVSSGFSTRRWHPILRYSRPHYGVDFAAPAGRAVVASGDGTVVFQGRKDGYGNALIIRHGKRYQTVYGHLSRFAREVRFNGTVKRGQVIGYVGATGLATGPHLHYELHVDNRPVDPLTADLPFIEPLDEGEKARFKRSIKPLLAELRRQDEALLAATR